MQSTRWENVFPRGHQTEMWHIFKPMPHILYSEARHA